MNASVDLLMNVTETGYEDDEPQWLTITAYVLATLVVILILVLNPIGLVVLRRITSLQETTKLFMASLTMSDLSIGVFCSVPALVEVYMRRWPLGEFPCLLWGVVYPALILLSALSLLLISIDRFVAIVYSLRYNDIMTPRRAKIALAITWSSVLTLCTVLFGIVTPSVSVKETDYICDYLDVTLYQGVAVTMIVFTQGLVLLMYFHILHVARSQARRIAAAENSIGGAASSVDRQNPPQRISTKSATTVVIITGTLFLCWTPAAINTLLAALSVHRPTSFNVLIKAIFFCNNWLNIVIYYWRNKALRETLNRSMASFCRCTSH